MSIAKIIESYKRLEKIREGLYENGVIGTATDGVHMDAEFFMEFFGEEDFEIKKRNSINNPVRLIIYQEDVEFFALLDSGDFQKDYIRNNKKIREWFQKPYESFFIEEGNQDD